jgi:site-specific recombinase XerD
MAVTLKLYAISRKTKSNGEVPIYLRITKDRKFRYISTGISVEPRYWNELTCEVRKSHPRHARLNQELDDFVESAREKISDLKPSSQTVFTVRERVSQKDGKNFFDYAQKFALELAADDNLFESRQTLVLMDQFANYLKTRNLEFADVTLKKLMGFRTYLEDVKENGPNTINKKIKRFRRIFKQARKEGEITEDPFRDYESLPSEKADKYRLSFLQINAISELPLKHASKLWHTRNAFLFSYYNAGIRFGDLCTLKWTNLVDGYLVYRMAKTDTIKRIKLTKPANEILALYRKKNTSKDSYIFPLLSSEEGTLLTLKQQIGSRNALVNKHLKQIATMAGIEGNITFHVARHSFADFARQSKMSIYDISKALGHSDIKITEQYLASFDDLSLDSGMEDLFGKA